MAIDRVKEEKELTRVFGLASFREHQLEAIECLLENNDLLAVMPTGAGKSLIYQYAACRKPGVTLIISPLIALMKDQVDKLVKKGISATFINSTLSPDDQLDRLRRMVNGEYTLVYVAPERLRQYFFQEDIRKMKVSLLAVDEAHCISQWGHDFRPDYLHIATFRQFIGNPVVAALTATATPQVRHEIEQLIGLSLPKRIVTSFNRPNIRFEVQYLTSFGERDAQKLARLVELFEQWNNGSVIVYVGKRKHAENVAWFLRNVKDLPADYYHGGLEPTERERVQNGFMTGRIPVVVATNAFGMGIDRQDVRMVIHHTIPGSVEAYYQEAGRAGRDGKPARAILLYNPLDRELQEYFINSGRISYDDLYRMYKTILKGARGRSQTWIRPESLSQECGFDEEDVKVRVGLHCLEESKVLEQVYYEGLDRLVTLHHWNSRLVEEVVQKMSLYSERKIGQLERMITYAKNQHICHRNYILSYFGEQPTEQIRPNCCDVCDALLKDSQTKFAKTTKIASKQAPVSTKATSLAIPKKPLPLKETILECITELSGQCTKDQIIELLRGNLIGYPGLAESKYNGLLSGYASTRLSIEIAGLVDEHRIKYGQFGHLILHPGKQKVQKISNNNPNKKKPSQGKAIQENQLKKYRKK